MDNSFFTELVDKSEIILSSSGHSKHQKGTRVLKTFPDFDMMHFLAGSYSIVINDKKYAACPGDSFLLTPGSALILFANDDSEQLYYHFTASYAGKMNLTGDFEDYKLPPAQSALVALFKKYLNDCLDNKINKTAAQAALKSVFKIIILEMVFLNDENLHKFMSNSNCPFSNRFLNVIRYIQANPGIPLKNSSLAAMAGFSQCYFSRYFKKHTGQSVSSYIDNVKMNAAKQLLLDKKVPVKEAALELGYSDQFVFSKKFKKHFGLPPNEFKKINI